MIWYALFTYTLTLVAFTIGSMSKMSSYNLRDSTLAARAAPKEALPVAPKSVGKLSGRKAEEARVADREEVDPDAQAQHSADVEEAASKSQGAVRSAWEVLGEGLRSLAGRVDELEAVVRKQEVVIDNQESVIIELRGTLDEFRQLVDSQREELGKLRCGVEYAVSCTGRHHSSPEVSVKSEHIDHGTVKGFMASLAAFNISGDSQARVWEFIASARNAARVYDVFAYDAAILAPRFVPDSPAGAWFLHTVTGAPQRLTVEQALASLAFRFKDDVHVIEREARGLKQGAHQWVQEWRAQVEMLTTRWAHAHRRAEEPMIPEADKVTWLRLTDRIFQDHTKRIYSTVCALSLWRPLR